MSDDREFPASADQEFMWYAVELDPERPTYNVPYRAELNGPVDPEALRAALTDLLERHEPLRTTFRFRDDALRQVVGDPAPVDVPVIDLRGTADAGRRAGELAETEARRLFDLANGPLLRATLIRLDDRQHHLILVIHHLVFDGWSTTVLFDDLATAYDARAAGGRPAFTPLKMRYGDFARWQRDRFAGPERSRLLEYWRSQLDDVPHVLTFPSDRPRAGGRDATHAVPLPAALDQAVRALTRAERATHFTTMLAAYAVLLHGYTGEPAFLIGTPMANRPRPETAAMVGLFVNMLPLRADLTAKPTYRELIGQLRETVLSAYTNQLPTQHIVADVRPERRRGLRPLFQVLYWLHERGPGPRRIGPGGELELEYTELLTGAAMYSVELGVRDTAEGMRCEFTYNAAEFDADAIARMAARYLAVLERMTADPDQPVPTTSPTLAPPEPAGLPPAGPPSSAERRALERSIAETWRSLLGVAEVGLYDNFFDLGGHSQLMVRVRDGLAESLGVRVSLLDLFEYPTVAALAEHLSGTELEAPAPDADDITGRQLAGRLRLRQTKGNAE